MKPKYSAQAGTFESSDIMILIEPAQENSGRVIELNSTVMLQYGDNLKEEINKVLDAYELTDMRMIVKDKGALAATISARVETAVKRSLGLQEGTL